MHYQFQMVKGVIILLPDPLEGGVLASWDSISLNESAFPVLPFKDYVDDYHFVSIAITCKLIIYDFLFIIVIVRYLMQNSCFVKYFYVYSSLYKHNYHSGTGRNIFLRKIEE